SSLIIQFVESQFAETYYPTIENTFTKIVKHRNQEFAVEIIDTAGQDEYSILNPRHAAGIHGYVLVYSIASRPSFDMCAVVRDKILALTGTDGVPLVLVGNKADLASARQVPDEDGRALATGWGASFVETSAKVGTNVTRIFELMLAEVEKVYGEPADDKAGGCTLL
ncbi:GTP-binding protein, partial [Cladochytrium tenue]